MKAFLKYVFLSFVGIAAVLSCNTLGQDKAVEIRAISIGYDADNEDMSSRFEDDRFSDKMFSAFNAQSDIDAAKEYSGKGFEVETSRFNYQSEATFRIRTIPENAMVRDVAISSTNKDVLEVVKVEGKDVTVRLHDVGETRLLLTVKGAFNELSNEYPLRIVTPVNVDFYITPYWLGCLNTRLRVKATTLPMGLKSCAATYQDSVTVVGYCEYYDIYNHGTTPKVKRDSIRFGFEEQVVLLKKNSKRCIRNITSAIRKIRKDWHVDGSRIIVNEYGRRDTVAYRYGFVVEQVILDFNVFGANPYYEYYFTSKYDRTSDVIVVDEETGEETGEIRDGGTDEEEDYDEEKDNNEIKREDKAFFVIRLNDFMSQAERDRLSLDFRRQLDEIDYDDSRLTDEEKERRLKDIEDKKKNGE